MEEENKMKKVLLLLLFLAFTSPAVAAVNYESITVADSAIGLTASIITGITDITKTVKSVVCRLETAEIRFRVDGSDPTNTEGVLLEVGEIVTLEGNDITQFKAIRTGGSSGVLKCTYQGY